MNEHFEGVCPVCGSEQLDYEQFEKYDENGIHVAWECDNCKSFGHEQYDIDGNFIEHSFICDK